MTDRFTDSSLRKKGFVWDGKKWVPLKHYILNPVKATEFGSTVPTGRRRFHVKPMSVNGAWKGRRYKTDEYKAYTRSLLSILPDIKLPTPPYEIYLAFGFSSKASDWDNPVKPIQDILQKRYDFDDKLIYKAVVEKFIVPKRQEYFEFEIKTLKR